LVSGSGGLLITERRHGGNERRHGDRRRVQRRRRAEDRRQGDRRLGPTNRRVPDAESVPGDPTGLLLIRAWTEQESAQPLRAHIRVTGDISIGIERSFTAVDAATVIELVEEWLRGIVDG
jgi:hypothetical protein